MNEDFYELDGALLEEYYGVESVPRIPERVTEIGKLAFNENEWLEKIEVPARVRKIGAFAFNECCLLREAVLHEGLETIDESAFADTGLQKIRLPQSLKKLGCGAFSDTDLHQITIPGNVESIEMLSFFCCEKLRSVVLEPGVRSIGISAFALCSGLEEITIPDTVEEIAFSAFYGCDRLCRIHVCESWKQSHPLQYQRIRDWAEET